MKITLIFMLISCVAFNNGDAFGSDSYENKRASRILSNTMEILKNQKDSSLILEDKFVYLQSFITFNNENIKQTILEELKPEYDKWSKIVHEECIINGQFAIDQLRVLHALHNIKKVQEINTLLSSLDFELIEKFVTIINKLK